MPVRADDFDSFEVVANSLEDLIERESSAPAGSDPEEQKKYLFAFAPHRLVKPYRLLANVAEVTLMVLDVDRCNVDELHKAIKAWELQAFVYTSPSDKPDGDPDARRVRVVAPLTRPLTPAETPDMRRRFAELLGVGPGQGVEGAIDAAKIFFCGRLHDTPPRESWRFEGTALDPDLHLAIPLEYQWGKGQAATVELRPLDELPPADAGIAAALGDWTEHAGRKWHLCGAVGGLMRKLGMPRNRCESTIREWLPKNDPAVNVPNAVKQALGAWRYRPDEVSGIEALTELIGEKHAAIVFEACATAAKTPGHDARVARAKKRAKAKADAKKPADDETDEDNSDPDAAKFHAPDDASTEPRSDLGNARRLVRLHGEELRHCSARDVWLVWDGHRWAEDETGEVMRRAKASADSLFDEVRESDDRKAASAWAVQSSNVGRLEAAIKLAKTEPGIAVRVTDLDSDPWLLNVTNGTLDLRTGELCDPDPDALMTKSCSTHFDSDARSDLWDAFVLRTFGGDRDLARYVQRALGYALFGAHREKAFWFGYGPQDGAKSTFIGVVGAVLGSYHVSVDPETWMVRHNIGGNRGDLVRLVGARLATSLEIRPGLRFDAALMKKATGGDSIVAAAKYEGEIEFPPTFALWMGANDRPIIPDDDDAFWGRVRCVPFTNVVPLHEQDKALRSKLTSEEHAPAVLAWLVEGCLAWQSEGIGSCSAVQDATQIYRRDMNRVAGFAEERLELTRNPEDTVAATVMRNAYEAYCDAMNIRAPLSPKAFGQRLRALGVGGGDNASRQSGKGAKRDRYWTGVRLAE